MQFPQIAILADSKRDHPNWTPFMLTHEYLKSGNLVIVWGQKPISQNYIVEDGWAFQNGYEPANHNWNMAEEDLIFLGEF